MGVAHENTSRRYSFIWRWGNHSSFADFWPNNTFKIFPIGTPSNGLKMEIVFKRRLTNELLTTYLPSFLLLLMSYATAHFKSFYFEAAVTVNLSILLVTTTLFIRWKKTLKSLKNDRNSSTKLSFIISIFYQCDGETSCYFVCAFGRYLAHIWATLSIYSGTIIDNSCYNIIAFVQGHFVHHNWIVLWGRRNKPSWFQ